MGQPAKLDEHMIHEISELICAPHSVDKEIPLFDVQVNEQIFGPIQGHDLKEFFIVNEELLDDTKVKRISEELYVPYFEHPHFQRRKPQLVSQQSLEQAEDENFWLLQKGQKMGPYTSEKITEMVENSDILRTDLISLDEGQTWQKLYKVEEFDRRNLSSHQLPPVPDGKVFVESLRETRIQLTSNSSHKEEADALTGLAFIGNLKAGKSVESDKNIKRPVSVAEQASSAEENAQDKTHWGWTALFLVSVLGIVFLLSTWNSDSPQEVEQAVEPVQSTQGESNNQELPTRQVQETQPQAPLEPQRPQIQERVNATETRNEPRSTRSRANERTTSFRESRAFQENDRSDSRREMIDETYEQDNYYYDEGDVPLEQDPVRRQLSRETTDPQNTWADDLESIDETEEVYEDYGVEEAPFEEAYEEY